MRLQRAGFAGASVWLLAVVSVLAHEGATGITAERMEVMKDMASHMKALGMMLDGRKVYDAADARDHALALHENCHSAAGHFHEATHDHHSRAAPAVWEQPEKFRDQMDGLVRAVTELVAATSSGRPDAMRQPFIAVGRACKSCHETFRLPEE